MSCYHPIKAYKTPDGVVFNERARHDIIGNIELPCGMCVGCRMRRATDWTLRCMHEAQMHNENCCITLTYGRGNLPRNGSLDHTDFQKFLKRLRKANADKTIRYYMCGEYGELHGRPHYHANIFGKDFRDRTLQGKSDSGADYYNSKELEQLWGHGQVSVQDLTKETAGYTTQYIMKKRLGEDAKTGYEIELDGKIITRAPEYGAMSLKPGIGQEWFKKYMRDVFPHDRVVANGKEYTVPKYYDKLHKRLRTHDRDEIEYQREQEAKKHSSDQTDERRRATETVHKAQIRNKLRTLS